MKNSLIWSLRILAAFILLQTLFFKFTAAEESVYIFSTLGLEPWGRITSGVVELIAGILLLFPKTTIYGAIISIGVMLGAIVSHLTVLGIEVMGDHGQLFAYACIETLACIILLNFHKKDLLALKNKYIKS